MENCKANNIADKIFRSYCKYGQLLLYKKYLYQVLSINSCSVDVLQLFCSCSVVWFFRISSNRNTYFLEHLSVFCSFFFDWNVSYSHCFYLFLQKIKRPVLFSTSWLLFIVIDKFAKRNSCGYCFRHFGKFTGTSAVKFSVKLSSANMSFVDCFGLKFFPDYSGHRGAF